MEKGNSVKLIDLTRFLDGTLNSGLYEETTSETHLMIETRRNFVQTEASEAELVEAVNEAEYFSDPGIDQSGNVFQKIKQLGLRIFRNDEQDLMFYFGLFIFM